MRKVGKIATAEMWLNSEGKAECYDSGSMLDREAE